MGGSPKAPRRGRWVILALLLTSSPADAGPREGSLPTETELDFLEFLGAWRTEDGQWADPFETEDLCMEPAIGECPYQRREREWRGGPRRNDAERRLPAESSDTRSGSREERQ